MRRQTPVYSRHGNFLGYAGNQSEAQALLDEYYREDDIPKAILVPEQVRGVHLFAYVPK